MRDTCIGACVIGTWIVVVEGCTLGADIVMPSAIVYGVSIVTDESDLIIITNSIEVIMVRRRTFFAFAVWIPAVCQRVSVVVLAVCAIGFRLYATVAAFGITGSAGVFAF